MRTRVCACVCVCVCVSLRWGCGGRAFSLNVRPQCGQGTISSFTDDTGSTFQNKPTMYYNIKYVCTMLCGQVYDE